MTLVGTIGWYRWSRILTGHAEIKHFQADHAGGSDWYRRAIQLMPIASKPPDLYCCRGGDNGDKVRSQALDQLAVVILVA